MEWCFGGEADRPWQVALLLLGARNDHLSTSEGLVGCNKSCRQQRRARDTAHCAQSPTLVRASRQAPLPREAQDWSPRTALVREHCLDSIGGSPSIIRQISEGRRVGEEWGVSCSTRWLP